QGDYFFSDFGGGWIYRLNYNPTTQTFASAPILFASNINAPVDLKTDDAGNLYYLSRTDGAVYQVRTSQAPAITQGPADLTVNEGEPATFTVTASGGGLNYQWQRANGTTPNTFVNIQGATLSSFTIDSAGPGDHNDRFRVIVSNDDGQVIS